MRKLIINLLLFSISILLFSILLPFGLIFSILVNILLWEEFVNYFSKILLKLAVGIDQLGNVVCGVLFNYIFIKKENQNFLFGDEKETVSSVLGKNMRINNLTKIGIILVKILNFIDKDHVIKYIKE